MIHDGGNAATPRRAKPDGGEGAALAGAGGNRAPNQIILSGQTIKAALENQPLLSGLLVTSAGFLPKSTQPPPIPPQPARTAVLLYCVHGSGWHEADNRLHPVRKGDLLLLTPGTQQTCRGHPRDPWTLHWVHALGSRLPAYLCALKGNTSPVMHVGEDPQLIRLFNEILRSLQRGTGFIHLLPAAHALGYILALLIQKRQDDPTEPGGTIQKVAEAIICMSEHIDQPLRVSALARQASLSPAYFGELFKDQTGCSPRDYLHLLRMHRACQLLQGTSWSMKRIATSLGYQDPFHFSRQFKAFQGISPSQYRQNPAPGS